ncbi:hypothetical protein HPB47_014543, partial [Ixodes persulcatus]
ARRVGHLTFVGGSSRDRSVAASQPEFVSAATHCPSESSPVYTRRSFASSAPFTGSPNCTGRLTSRVLCTRPGWPPTGRTVVPRALSLGLTRHPHATGPAPAPLQVAEAVRILRKARPDFFRDPDQEEALLDLDL